MNRPLRLFYSYSHHDEPLRAELEKHLTVLRRQGVIEGWSDRCVDPGEVRQDRITAELARADVILLLVSKHFLASESCWDVEMAQAMARHQRGEARVIPVLLSAVDWAGAPFAALQPLPRDARPVTRWSDRDEAWTDVARGIRRVVESLGASPAPASPASPAAPAPTAASATGVTGVTIHGPVKDSAIIGGSGHTIHIGSIGGK